MKGSFLNARIFIAAFLRHTIILIKWRFSNGSFRVRCRSLAQVQTMHEVPVPM